MNETLVCDTSPLLYLGRIAHLHLLPALFATVRVPDTVLLELDAGRLLRSDTVNPRLLEWVTPVTVAPEMLARLPETRLGAGERSVIAYALATGSAIVGLDDRQARLAAEALGLRVTGTVGVLLRAKRAGRIGSAREALLALQAEGFRMDAQLLAGALRMAGEA